MRRLLLAALALWVGRWAAHEFASRIGNRLFPYVPQDFSSPHAPGHMPGPFDR
jgi:hypothetical protein